MTTPTLYQGIAAPEALPILVTAGTSGFDLTTATAAEILVQLPDGTTSTWSGAQLVDPTTTEVTVVYTFSGTELPQVGTYNLIPRLSVPGGKIRGLPFAIHVKSEFDTSANT